MKTLKNKLIIWTFVFIPIIAVSQSSQLENNDFEQWTDNYHPVGWNTEIDNNGVIISTAEQTTDAYNGRYAVKLETQRILTNDVVPGMIQLGKLDIDHLVPTGGVAFNGGKPTGFSVYMKYSPVGGDSVVIFSYLYRRNTETNRIDTLAGSYMILTDQIPDYQEVIVPIYYIREGDPDSINLGFFSSGFAPHEGSVLYIDKITLLYEPLNFPPLALSATEQTDSSFIAHWTASVNATDFIIDVAYDKDFTNFINGYEHLHVGDTNKITVRTPYHKQNCYYYRLKAIYDSIQSDWSNTIRVIIPWTTQAHEPQNITATSFTATWDYQPLATHFMFQVATDSLFKNILPKYEYYPIDTNITTVIGLEPETEYFYRVSVRYNKLSSDWSNVVKIKTLKMTDNERVKVYGYPDRIVIYSHKSIYGAYARLISLNGTIYWQKELNQNLITLSIPGPSVYLLQIIKPDGTVIIKKVIAGY